MPSSSPAAAAAPVVRMPSRSETAVQAVDATDARSSSGSPPGCESNNTPTARLLCLKRVEASKGWLGTKQAALSVVWVSEGRGGKHPLAKSLLARDQSSTYTRTCPEENALVVKDKPRQSEGIALTEKGRHRCLIEAYLAKI